MARQAAMKSDDSAMGMPVVSIWYSQVFVTARSPIVSAVSVAQVQSRRTIPL